VIDVIPVLLDNYHVLMYNGQNDVILSAAACQRFLQSLSWSNAAQWRNASKEIWYVAGGDGVNNGPAGYWKSYANFHYVVVRGAGHLLPQDQPIRAFDMITRFIDGTGL